eukprot:TRINITY_DN3490_c0_g1_i5.p1 TRINITY_DN3490_c0_g1~~TRINITY_DN3490_c0_g1_i5.p1  ORF type:complete len:159 (-),score=44.58 TRINITY_DN3490_c0_g1_i5:143-571(-)
MCIRDRVSTQSTWGAEGMSKYFSNQNEDASPTNNEQLEKLKLNDFQAQLLWDSIKLEWENDRTNLLKYKTIVNFLLCTNLDLAKNLLLLTPRTQNVTKDIDSVINQTKKEHFNYQLRLLKKIKEDVEVNVKELGNFHENRTK